MFALFRLTKELETIEPLFGTAISTGEEVEDGYVSIVKYTMCVTEGIYEGRVLHFVLKVPAGYPFQPPKLVCIDEIFHPNIDKEGNVCMEILRLGWSPGYGLENIFVNLHVIFLEIDGEDALNIAAGELFKSDHERFIRVAKGFESPPNL